MKKAILLFFALLSIPAAFAQYTVTATVTDTPDGQTWNNGTYRIDFYPTTAAPQPPPGVPATYSGALSSSGAFSLALPTVTPNGASWTFTVCPFATYIGNCPSTILLIGSSQSVSTQLSAIAKSPRFPPSYYAYGYVDSEVFPLPLTPGPSYWNVVSNTFRQWNGSTFQGSGGSGATFPSTAGVVYNTSTTASRNATASDIETLLGSVYLPLRAGSGSPLTGNLYITPASGDSLIIQNAATSPGFVSGVASQTGAAYYWADMTHGYTASLINGANVGGSAFSDDFVVYTYGGYGFSSNSSTQKATSLNLFLNEYANGTLGICATGAYACETGSLALTNLNAVATVSAGTSVSVGTASWTHGAGAPSGACVSGSLYSNTTGTTANNLYSCANSVWVDIN